ncbi:MAG: class I SAM-dependent methyltransferase [Solirubrobacterales bacterium]
MDLRNQSIDLARRAARTRPARRLADAIREDRPPPEPPPPPPPPPPDPRDLLNHMRVDNWLTNLFGAELDPIEERIAAGATGDEAYGLFRGLDDDLWALLLSGQYSAYPAIRGLLPDVPEPHLQLSWNGADGLGLLSQSKSFYAHVKRMHAEHHGGELSGARILDFGCGWGRLTRFFARDVPAGALHGCDPVESILDVCRTSRVPAELHRSDFVPESLPVDGIDVAFSFSVFTHLSERAAQTCLNAIHDALNPDGIAVLTIRPPDYLGLDEKMHGARDELGPDPYAAMSEPQFVFAPHGVDEGHPQYQGGEMTYGDTVVSLAYVREHWTERFELVDVRATLEDMFQVAVTLRRR